MSRPVAVQPHVDCDLAEKLASAQRAALKKHLFTRSQPEQLWVWQNKMRLHLRAALRVDFGPVYGPPSVTIVCQQGDRQAHITELAVQTDHDTTAPLWLVESGSASTGHRGMILILNSSTDTGGDIIGAAVAPAESGQPHTNWSWITDAIKAGFTVGVLDMRGYGAWPYTHPVQNDASASQVSYLAGRYLRSGQCYAGVCVMDAVRVIDYLESDERYGVDRLGVCAVGAGAVVGLYLAAIDQRVALTAIGDPYVGEQASGPVPMVADYEPLVGPDPQLVACGCVVPRALAVALDEQHLQRTAVLRGYTSGASAGAEAYVKRVRGWYALAEEPDNMTHLDSGADVEQAVGDFLLANLD